MRRSELIRKMAEQHPMLVAKDAEIVVKTILETMSNSLRDGRRIEIRGFGTLDINYRLPRIGRNPKSGERVMVPAKCAPHFKAAKELRDRINPGKR